MATPPSDGTFFSLPSAKNPIHCPSGEKNGADAPSVSVTEGAADAVARADRQLRRPSWFETEHQQLSIPRQIEDRHVVEGHLVRPRQCHGVADRRRRRGGGPGAQRHPPARGREQRSARATPRATAGAAPAPGPGPVVPEVGAGSGAASISMRASAMSRNRVFGSRSRQRRRTRRTEAGVSPGRASQSIGAATPRERVRNGLAREYLAPRASPIAPCQTTRYRRACRPMSARLLGTHVGRRP